MKSAITKAIKKAGQDLRPAVDELKKALYIVTTNEPINRKDGNIKQADFELKNADSYRKAIKKLS